MKIIERVCLILLSLLFLLSCVKEGNVIYVDIDEEADEPLEKVFYLIRKGALGDLGYMDDMYRGAVRGAQNCGIMLSLVELPDEEKKAVSSIETLLGNLQTGVDGSRALIILSNDGFETLLHNNETLLSREANVDFLLVESSDRTLPLHKLRLPQYGAYYQAGRLVCEGLSDVESVLVASANPEAEQLGGMLRGFSDALQDAESGIRLENTCFSETSGGYNEAGNAYRMSYKIEADLVLPLCGSTAQGFYRYNRENALSSFYTLGVDCDMQFYSPKVPLSVVKHISDAVEDWIFRWWQGEEMPLCEELGLSSGYTEIVIADSYKSTLEGIADKYYEKALEKEREYEDK